MKRIILVLMFLIISAPVYAQFFARIEVGNALEYGTTGTYTEDSPNKYVYSDILFGYRFRCLLEQEISYSFRTWAIRSDTCYIKNSPFREIYTGEWKLIYKPFYLKFNHFCNHAVYSAKNEDYWMDNRWGEQMTTISVGFEFGH